jgi:hypothetical protein
MAPDLRTAIADSSGLKTAVPRLGPVAFLEQPVDDLWVPGGQGVDTKYCVRPDSSICQKPPY